MIRLISSPNEFSTFFRLLVFASLRCRDIKMKCINLPVQKDIQFAICERLAENSRERELPLLLLNKPEEGKKNKFHNPSTPIDFPHIFLFRIFQPAFSLGIASHRPFRNQYCDRKKSMERRMEKRQKGNFSYVIRMRNAAKSQQKPWQIYLSGSSGLINQCSMLLPLIFCKCYNPGLLTHWMCNEYSGFS